MNAGDLARVLRAAAAECEAIVAEASAERVEWVDQHRSPLGPRRHCRAVRARVSARSGDAAVVGRRQLLSPTAVSEELARSTAQHRPKKQSIGDELRAELRLVGGT